MAEITRVRKINHPELNNYLISRNGDIFNKKHQMIAQTLTNGYKVV